MLITLSEIMADPLMRSAKPHLLAASTVEGEVYVRWVHTSELVQLAGLIRGAELLLTTGESVLALPFVQQLEYLETLAECHVAALVIETVGPRQQLPPEFVAAAAELELPLYQLQETVPFVALAEKINTRIVSEHASALQQADAISQQLAQHLAVAGPALVPLLEMIDNQLQLGAEIVNPGGEVIAASQRAVVQRLRESGSGQFDVTVDLYIGGDTAARLVLHAQAQHHRQRLELMAERLGSIVTLAYSQHYRPSPEQAASSALLQSIVNAGGENYVVHRAAEAQIAIGVPLCMLVLQGVDVSRGRAELERHLRAGSQRVFTYVQAHRLYVLCILDPATARRSRAGLVRRLRAALHGEQVECCVGPIALDVSRARWSLTQAESIESWDAASESEGAVRDALDYALQRLVAQLDDPVRLREFITEQIGELVDADRDKDGQLLKTLEAWLASGCHATDTAARLYVERQTLHKRLAKIFALIGGDPRSNGRVLPVHLAAWLALQG
ncbi:PucR family transcriptional regulator [Glutamicibacter protophormiae]